MTKLKREIDIEAPPERVYDVLADPSCLGEWVTIQEELEEAPAGDLTAGSKLRQRMKVAGQRFRLHWTVVQADRPTRIVWEGRGPVGTKAKAIYELSPNGDSDTRFSYLNEYELPGGWLGRIAERTVARVTAREVDATMQKLKSLLE